MPLPIGTHFPLTHVVVAMQKMFAHGSFEGIFPWISSIFEQTPFNLWNPGGQGACSFGWPSYWIHEPLTHLDPGQHLTPLHLFMQAPF